MSDTESSEGKKGKPVVLIVIALNVVLGGGAAAFFLLQGGEAAPAAAHAESADGAAQAAKAGAPILEFPPIIVNLNEPEGTRYLKTTIAVQLADEKAATDIDRLKPVIKDHFIRDLSELNFRQTMGSKNKMAIKRRLLQRFNEAVGKDIGVEVLLTEFVVQ